MRPSRFSPFFFCFSFCLLLFGTGCPNKTTPPDGGEATPDGIQVTEKPPQVTCSAGSTCLKVSDPAIRSCQVMLEIPAGETAQGIALSEQVLGRTMQKSGRLGIAFFVREDKPLEQPAASFTSITTATILKQTCFDGNGRPLEKAAILLEKK